MPSHSEIRSLAEASLLAKNVKDNARFLEERGALESFASKLAPTLGQFVLCDTCNPHIFEEKLQIPANIWYKVSRSERV
jgi:hypothetical protein